MGGHGKKSRGDLRGMRDFSGALSLFAKIPPTACVVSEGWTASRYREFPVFTCRVHPGESPPGLRVAAVDRHRPVPSIISQDLDASRVVPWTWFFRDFVGFEPERSEATGDIGPVITLAREEVSEGNLVVLAGEGESSLHSFRFVDDAEAPSSVRGLLFPFQGPSREVTKEGFRPLLVDATGRSVAVVRYSPRPRLVLGFDPLVALWQDTRTDQKAESAAINTCWTALMMEILIWCTPFILWKGIWPDDVPPLIYSVDVEAGALYFDADSGRCSWAVGRPTVRQPADVKLEHSLSKAMERLERRGLVGTFHIDLNAVRDERDQVVLRDASVRHDIAFHLPRVGGHEAWAALLRDADQVQRVLEEGVQALAEIKGGPVVGNRYGSWLRTSATHDVVAALGLGYDSSSLAHRPFWTIPYRMAASGTGRHLDLWEFPCVEVIDVVKAGPHRLVGLRTRRRRGGELREYLISAARESFMAVLCDHDTALGAARGHVHGTWRLDALGLSRVLHLAGSLARKGHLKPLRGSEFLGWWKITREARFTTRFAEQDDHATVDLHLRWSEHLSN